MTYRAPVKDMLFAMTELADLPGIGAMPGCEDATVDTARAVLEENAKFVEQVVAPLNRIGDTAPPVWKDGAVATSAGFKAAFAAYGEAGWQGVQHDPAFGGQGLPKLIATPCIEMVNAANLSFALCPLLTDGAIEALMTAGTAHQKQTYLGALISGKWTGTMNLTEPQAGSDLAQVRSRAVPQDDGTYRIFGQKIYITYGEHDMAENIVHLVLARTPDAPEGVKGISLFIVPKFLPEADGTLGRRNDVYCASIEHKLGIRGSPTAVLIYGDDQGDVGAGAIGTLVGDENRGLEYMFIMMNAARFQVGMQGIAVADRAYQQATAYARDRVQGRDVIGSAAPVSIIHHPDVRRMLMTMRAQVEGARALAYVTAAAFDIAHHATDAETRKHHQAFYEFMVPIVKGWSTEMSIEVASTGIQIHGGMGFIEETGAAQHLRDARILTIYEGTTAIQANDLVGRKTVRDGGAVARSIIEGARGTVTQLKGSGAADLMAIGERLSVGLDSLEAVVTYLVAHMKSDVQAVFAGSVTYLKLAGMVLCGWQMGRAALAAQARAGTPAAEADFDDAKRITALFYAEHIVAQASGLKDAITQGASSVMGLPAEAF